LIIASKANRRSGKVNGQETTKERNKNSALTEWTKKDNSKIKRTYSKNATASASKNKLVGSKVIRPTSIAKTGSKRPFVRSEAEDESGRPAKYSKILLNDRRSQRDNSKTLITDNDASVKRPRSVTSNNVSSRTSSKSTLSAQRNSATELDERSLPSTAKKSQTLVSSKSLSETAAISNNVISTSRKSPVDSVVTNSAASQSAIATPKKTGRKIGRPPKAKVSSKLQSSQKKRRDLVSVMNKLLDAFIK
jgi:hypothetical protein